MARRSKKRTALWALLAALLIVAVVLLLVWYFAVYKKGITIGQFLEDLGISRPSDDGKGPSEIVSGDIREIVSADLSIHFIAPAVKASGDCTLIKAGDTEVLIDAGPTQGNVTEIKDYLADYCTDGVLEYVIATHADTDHIAGLVGTSEDGVYNGILYSYEIGTIITFDRTNKKEETPSGNPTLYGRYLTALDYAEEHGAEVYTGMECTEETGGARRTYYLDDAQTISMNILYNYYYDHSSGDENNYSVCMLLSQKTEGEEHHYLFTGDLEEDGEERLVENNRLPHVRLYKAGHHGSKTSSTNALLDVITPEYVAVCCCAGYNEYGAAEENIFPTQAFIDRIGRHTSYVYVTIVWDEETDGFEEMNGDIVFYYGAAEGETQKSLKLWCSNNDTVLKDTAWFLENRVWSGSA